MKRRRAAVYVLGDPGGPPSNDPFNCLKLITNHVDLYNCIMVESWRDRDDATYFAGYQRLLAEAREGKAFEVVFVFASTTNLLHPRLLEMIDELSKTSIEVKCVFDFYQESLR